jgi:hypothetical protein
MSLTDWIIDIALILVVFRQLRESKLSWFTILLPLAIIAWACTQYLHGVPTAGNDLLLITVAIAVGVVFGLFSGLLTRVRRHDGHVYIRATIGAAAVWVVAMGFRLVFEVWASHPSGAAHLGSFSVTHDITSGQAWVTALLLMAFAQVVVRLAIIIVRGQLAGGHDSAAVPAA